MATDIQGSKQELKELLEKFDTALLTTVSPDGFRARPMAIHMQKDVPDADLAFFSFEGSAKVAEILENERVGVACFRPSDGTYLSISARASVTRDQGAVKRAWGPGMKLWFPEGPESPDIVVLKLHVESADYWSAGGKLKVLFSMAKAVTHGKAADEELPPVKRIR